MIFFKTIRWKNFLSTGNAFTEVDLATNKTTLIVGENGAGKSTLLDALCFALYNKPFRKINKPQLVNSINKNNLVVEVEFSIGPGNYKVVRGLKPALFEVYKNDTLLNQDADSRDYQDVLESQILKLNHKSFCQVVVVGSASFVPFMQLSAQHRREVIEDLLDIQIFSTMNSLLKEKINDNAKLLDSTNAGLELASEKIKLTNDHLEAMKKSADERIDALRSELKHLMDRIELEKQSAEDIDQQIATIQDQINDKEKIEDKYYKIGILEKQIQSKIDRLCEEISFYQQHDDCPTCRQSILSGHKAEMVSSRLLTCQVSQEGLEKLNNERDTLSNRLNEIKLATTQITELSLKGVTHRTSAKNLFTQAKKVAHDIEENEERSEQFLDANSIQELEKALEDYQLAKGEFLRDKDALFVASLVLKDTGIKARIIKQYVPVINKLINKYLAALDFFVMFELDENFNETIKSRHRDDFSYASFSEGEKMRINLAILFTWRAVAKLRNSASTNLLIMDEVLDGSLDGNGTDEFLKILNNLTQDTNTFIISHKVDQMYDKFTNILKFEKHKNFSRIAT